MDAKIEARREFLANALVVPQPKDPVAAGVIGSLPTTHARHPTLGHHVEEKDAGGDGRLHLPEDYLPRLKSDSVIYLIPR